MSLTIARISSVQFSRSVVSNSLRPHESQHTRPPCPSPTPGVYSNACPLSRWYHPIISSSVVPFSSRLQSFSASRSFPMSWFLTLGCQNIGVSTSASVLPMNIQDSFPLGLTDLTRLWSMWSVSESHYTWNLRKKKKKQNKSEPLDTETDWLLPEARGGDRQSGWRGSIGKNFQVKNKSVMECTAYWLQLKILCCIFKGC